MLHVVVVLKGDPLPQFEVVCTLEQIFFKDLSAKDCRDGIHQLMSSAWFSFSLLIFLEVLMEIRLKSYIFVLLSRSNFCLVTFP